MRKLYNSIRESISDYDSFWQWLYYHDRLEWFYNLTKIPSRIIDYFSKFIYYGKIGTSCVDFDASSSYRLIYAHIRRVRKFMDSDNTHLMWNSDGISTGLIRKLYELEERLKRVVNNTHETYFNMNKLRELEESKFKRINIINFKYTDKETEYKYLKLRKIAMKKDRLINEQHRKRLNYLITHYIDFFWD